MTKYLDLKIDEDFFNKISDAAQAILNGDLVIFPTETVYGLGANGLDSEAVNKIFFAKGRNSDNPLILHIADFKMLDRVAQNISPLEKELMTKFWPGPLTIILNKKEVVPNNVSAGLNTVGVRMPKNPIALELIKQAGIPIAAPSANISGRPRGTNINDKKEE